MYCFEKKRLYIFAFMIVLGIFAVSCDRFSPFYSVPPPLDLQVLVPASSAVSFVVVLPHKDNSSLVCRGEFQIANTGEKTAELKEIIVQLEFADSPAVSVHVGNTPVQLKQDDIDLVIAAWRNPAPAQEAIQQIATINDILDLKGESIQFPVKDHENEWISVDIAAQFPDKPLSPITFDISLVNPEFTSSPSDPVECQIP